MADFPLPAALKFAKNKNYKIDSKSHLRKVKRPDYQTLINNVKELGYTKTGRKYGVSDNAIRKWIKHYEKHIL